MPLPLNAPTCDDALQYCAVFRTLKGDGAAVAACERESANGDVLGTGLHLEKALQHRHAHFWSDVALLPAGSEVRAGAHITFLRPEIQRAAAFVVVPLSGGIQLLQGILEMVAVVRVEVVAAVLLEREQSCLRIERSHGFHEIPPAVLREDVQLHVLGVRPLTHVFRLHIKRALPQVAFRCASRRKLGYKGPAAVEGIFGIEVRIAREDLPLAVAKQLFGDEPLRQQLGDIRLHNLALMRLPAGDDRCADERALAARDRQIRILRFELNRLRQLRHPTWQQDRCRRAVASFTGLTDLVERLGQREGRGDLHLQGMRGGKQGCGEREEQ